MQLTIEQINKIWEEKRPEREKQEKRSIVRELYRLLPSGAWKGRRCFIIGGGPSAKQIDYDLLKGELIIGINRAYELIDPTMLFWSDTRFWGWAESGKFGDESRRKFVNSKAIKVALDYTDFPYPEGVRTVKALEGDGVSKDLSQGIYCGYDSGYAALSIAVALGCTEIYLIGFDMHAGSDGKQVNFHDGYPESMEVNSYKNSRLKLERNGATIKRLGVKVYNLNPDSAIRCFQFADIKDVLATKKAVYFDGYLGIGDNFYMRPLVRHLAKRYETVYVSTPTPEIFWDIDNVKPVYPDKMTQRCSVKNAKRYPDNFWHTPPEGIEYIKAPHYWVGFRAGMSVGDFFESTVAVGDEYEYEYQPPREWIDLAQQTKDEWLAGTSKKLCIVRWPTVRAEWPHHSRAPKPEYMQKIIDAYKDEYYFVSLADIEDGKEWFVGEGPMGTVGEGPQNIDRAFHHGELSLREVFGLISAADLVLCQDSFFMAAAIAMRRKTFVIWGGSIPPGFLVHERMGLHTYGYAAPRPHCSCLRPDHDCDKTIPEHDLMESFRELHEREIDRRQKLLLSRVPPEKAIQIAQNKYLRSIYDIYVIDQLRLLKEYAEVEHLFAGIEAYVGQADDEVFEDIKKYIKAGQFDKVVISQPLFRLANATEQACRELGVPYLLTENFFGNRLIFDSIGCQYTPQNEIVRYVDRIKMANDIKKPTQTRQPQPLEISADDFFQKYELDPGRRYIVVFGQVDEDMSIRMSNSVDVLNYHEYLTELFNQNPDTIFIFKHHPQKCIDGIETNENVVVVDENIQTLFRIFDKFTAFSSTTIFEGLCLNKKFATCGHHFVNDSRIVYQLKYRQSFKDLWNKLDEFTIDNDTRWRYLYFICNYYAVEYNGRQLLSRLTMSPDKYYSQVY